MSAAPVAFGGDKMGFADGARFDKIARKVLVSRGGFYILKERS
jgi:hypothetical protein